MIFFRSKDVLAARKIAPLPQKLTQKGSEMKI